MIHLLGNRRDRIATELVLRAFQRCFTSAQVRLCDTLQSLSGRRVVAVVMAPDDTMAPDIERIAGQGGKVVLLGPLGPRMSAIAAIDCVEIAADFFSAADCAPAPVHATSESRAALCYARSGLGRNSPLQQRRFCRYDFANEWNNLGYGRIGMGYDRWSVGHLARNCEETVADVTVDGLSSLGAAATLRRMQAGAVLWFARPVGPIDGPDWAVIEAFISEYGGGDLVCLPFLRDIPHGFGAAVTMRLDCDEDIASARPLLEFYRSRGRPLSLAVKTDQPERPAHTELMDDLLRSGGSILSHSVTHAPNWGGSAESAEREARDSKTWLENQVEGLTVRYAVSPFHQNPAYVPPALARAGYDGFVGGIIANDPEYMMARAGVPPFGSVDLISHTQGCMLHGDCLLASGDPLRIYKDAFSLARDGGQFFGYLDHPFSERYAYGWASESDRIAAHAGFLDFMEAHSGNGPLLFVNEDTCLDFIKGKAATQILYDDLTDTYKVTRSYAAGLPLSVSFHGTSMPAGHG